jgi:hypothetical protein
MPAGSATIDAGATFAGNILANASITFGTGATLDCGRALASTGDVTMLTNYPLHRLRERSGDDNQRNRGGEYLLGG